MFCGTEVLPVLPTVQLPFFQINPTLSFAAAKNARSNLLPIVGTAFFVRDLDTPTAKFTRGLLASETKTESDTAGMPSRRIQLSEDICDQQSPTKLHLEKPAQ